MAESSKDDVLPVAQENGAGTSTRSFWDWGHMADIAPIGVFRSTPEGRFTYVNDELARIFEFDSREQMEEEVVDIATQILARPEQREHFKTALENNGLVSGFIYDIRTRGNRIRQASLTARLVHTVDGNLYAGFLIDVTDQTQAQSRLEMLLRDVQGMAYQCECKPPWRMLWVSAGCGELTGYTPELLKANTPDYEALIHPDYQGQIADGVDEALRRKKPYTLCYPIETAGGEWRWVIEKGRAVWGPDGKPLHLEGFVISANRLTNVSTREEKEFKARREFQKIRLRAVFLWTFIGQFVGINLAVVVMLLLNAIGYSTMSETLLLGLTGQTVAQVVGLVYIIARYLFTENEASGAASRSVALTPHASPDSLPHIQIEPVGEPQGAPQTRATDANLDDAPGRERKTDKKREGIGETDKKSSKIKKIPPKG